MVHGITSLSFVYQSIKSPQTSNTINDEYELIFYITNLQIQYVYKPALPSELIKSSIGEVLCTQG